MKTQYSLVELASQLEDRANAKKDFIVPAKQLAMNGDANFVLDGMDNPVKGQELAHRQVASTLDIPARYYDRMRESNPALLADNVNHWMHKRTSKHMVRTINGDMRAFLSDRYQRIENEEIARVVLPILGEISGVMFPSTAITEQRMYIKAVFTQIQGEVSVGDIVQAGVCITNSEVGLGAFKVEPFMERLVCTNGMVINDARMSKTHLGQQHKEGDGVYELLSDQTRILDDRAFLSKVSDIVRSACDQVQFDKHVQKMREATEVKLEGSVEEAVTVLAKKTNLLEDERSNVLRHLIEGGDLSKWGLANAVTRTAQDVESYDRSHQLEELGGKIIDLNKTEWREIATA